MKLRRAAAKTIAQFYFWRARRKSWEEGYWELYAKGWKWLWKYGATN